ncbi:contact-dependent growth inhibition system immunity protein [Paenibacillus lentus]|uniref:contact-dependent growth inhibition system immunity protein n=1 Tax=Paenibacillus lentus TaxID=1338368 RepID=UPI003648EAC9
MNQELSFETFRYFLECYFNVSTNYDELEKIIDDFNSSENLKYRQSLKAELELILQLGNWDIVQRFVKKYGMRKMNEEKLKWLIQHVLCNLELSK